ncbi:MAG TPA: hypothetical protein VHW00_18135 [Thermoanaerobaculia bacterium]|nr:hypothetical protein [Thermoanaerobaculia bacterium]
MSAIHRDVPIGRRMRAIFGMGRLVEPLALPRGVRKFRSAEEAYAEREQFERRRIDRIRNRRQ